MIAIISPNRLALFAKAERGHPHPQEEETEETHPPQRRQAKEKSRGDRRGGITELVITNYEPDGPAGAAQSTK